MSYSKLLDYFPHFAGEFLPPMPEGFTDESWYNDTSPNISRELAGGHYLRIWIEHSDKAQREFQDLESDLLTYTLTLVDYYGSHETLCESDDWQVIAEFLDSHIFSGLTCGVDNV